MKVNWKVEGLDPVTSRPSDDIAPTSGSVVLENGVSSGQITLSVVADGLSELDEQFIVTLVSVDGGADIDARHQTSAFTVRCVSHSVVIVLIPGFLLVPPRVVRWCNG